MANDTWKTYMAYVKSKTNVTLRFCCCCFSWGAQRTETAECETPSLFYVHRISLIKDCVLRTTDLT